MRTGVIKDLEHTSGSGGITIVMEDGTRLLADNGPTIRSFDAMYGDVIIPGEHTFDKSKVIGKKIKYHIDDYGFMDGMDVCDE